MVKPVAYVTGNIGGFFVVQPIDSKMVLPERMALYAAPPKREWVGLTDDEWFALWEDSGTDMNWQSCREIAQDLITAKLKEKNSV